MKIIHLLPRSIGRYKGTLCTWIDDIMIRAYAMRKDGLYDARNVFQDLQTSVGAETTTTKLAILTLTVDYRYRCTSKTPNAVVRFEKYRASITSPTVCVLANIPVTST